MKRPAVTLILIMLCLQGMAQGYLNPVIPGFNPDPSVCRVGEDYYLVTSSFQYFPGVPVYHSKDLIHWEQIGNCLTRESQLKLGDARCWGGIYAPTIRYCDGLFYMVTTNVSDKGNFFVTAADPAGKWSEPVWLKQGGIDPTLYFEDGRTWLVSNPGDGIFLCEIDRTTGEQLSESRLLWRGDGGRYPEAPHIYKKDGWYYLMISEGGTELAHSVTISRSRRLEGPYKSNPGNPILTNCRQMTQSSELQGTGHGDLVQDTRGGWWMVFLGFRLQNGSHHLLGRETFLEPVVWNRKGWPEVGTHGTAGIDHSSTPTLPQAAYADLPVNRLESREFKPWMIYIDNPVESNYSFTTEGCLRLKPTAVTLDDWASPTFIGIRQDRHRFSLETEVDITGTASAGLSVYMDCFAHADISLHGGKSITVDYSLYGLKHRASEIPVSGSTAVLRIEGDKTFYRFLYRSADGAWTEAGTLDSRLLSCETSGGFTGIVLGMFATGGTAGSTADFKYLNYE